LLTSPTRVTTPLAVLRNVLWSFQIYNADATNLNSTQLLSQASKQRVFCAQQRDVTMLTTSLHCRPQSWQLSWVELRRRCKLATMQHGATYLAGSVDTDAEWLAVARSTVNDVVRQFTIHLLSVTARSHAVQSTPLRYCSQQHNNNSLL